MQNYEPQETQYVTSGVCGALTKKGGRCQRRVKGGGRCWQPVSYTHLDVYKRQVLAKCGEKGKLKFL